MSQQVVISLSREYGSGGQAIAHELSNRLNIPYYDKSILARVAEEKGIDKNELKQYEEKAAKPFFSKTVRGFNNSPQDAVAHMQFDLMRKMAKEGESFIIVGRCSEEVLKDVPGIKLITIFVTGDESAKVARVMERNSLSFKEAQARVKKVTRERKEYHNRYCKGKWGDSRNYDILINSSRLDVDKTADVLETYIKNRMDYNG